jgi:hypothetical protein
MRRIIVCSLALLAFITAVKYGLHFTLAQWGFWPYMAVCVAVGCGGILTAHLIDRADTRSREEQLRARRDFQ